MRGDSKEVGGFVRDRGDILPQDISVCVLGLRSARDISSLSPPILSMDRMMELSRGLCARKSGMLRARIGMRKFLSMNLTMDIAL